MRAYWLVPALACLVVVAVAPESRAQYGAAGMVFPGAPVHGVFQPMLPIDPSSGRAYADYVLNIAMPGSYTIDLVSSSSSAYDPYLVLLQNGMQVEANDDGGGYPNSRISRFLAPGSYIVRVSSFRRGPVGPASYTLTVSGGGGMAVGMPMGGAVLYPGVPVSGTMMPGLPMDPSHGRPYIDYTLSIPMPGTYQIDMVSASSSALDPYLYLLQNGVQLETNDDGGGYPNARITRFLAPGVYTVRAASFRRGHVGPAPFTVSVQRR